MIFEKELDQAMLSTLYSKYLFSRQKLTPLKEASTNWNFEIKEEESRTYLSNTITDAQYLPALGDDFEDEMMSNLHQNDATRKLAKPSSIITIGKGS